MADPIETFRAALLHRLGGAPDVISPGQRHDHFRTRRGRHAGWCFLFPNLRTGLYGCRSRHVDNAWFAHQAPDATPSAIDLAEARRLHAQRHRTVLYHLWNDASPITPADPAGRYFAERGLPSDDLPRLRFRSYGARLSKVWRDHIPLLWAPAVDSNGVLCDLVNVSRDAWGLTASEPSRDTLALFAPRAGRLGIAESLEAALVAHAETGIPTMAVTTLGRLAAWQWPREIHHLTVFTEDDDRGRQMATQLQGRALASGLRCEVVALRPRRPDRFDACAARMRATRN